jgi:hypothetical protein
MDILMHDSTDMQTDGKVYLKYYFKFIANFTNHTLGILKPK